MPPYLRKQAFRYPVYALLSVGVLIIGVLAYYNWIYALLASLFFIAFVFLGLLIVNAVRKETEVYISTLSYRLKRVGEEALLEMPIGILLFNDDFVIEWSNPFMTKCLQEDSLVGKNIEEVAESLLPFLRKQEGEMTLTIHDSGMH